ncbi:hypothetical protein BJX99DRAFT_224454, partial [Aspergillus californicus]
MGRSTKKKDGTVDQDKIIPAYYCCYLLRSTGTGCVRPALYIGSTPDPARRLAQHNGLVKGGARKTANDKRRPWEMTMLVEGFTSRIAALKFEWAWQHPAATRHLGGDDSDVEKENEANEDTGGNAEGDDKKTEAQKSKAKKKSKLQETVPGQEKLKDDEKKLEKRKKTPAARTRTSLKAHLEDLHLLLRSKYFSNWPLTLRFFAADVSQAWRLWCDRVDGSIPCHIKTIQDGNCTGSPIDTGEQLKVGSVNNIKADYTHMQAYLEKATFLLDDVSSAHCRVCKAQFKENELTVVCPHAGCNCTSHLLCLSKKFVEKTDPDQFVPLSGTCPTCARTVQWSLMMRELSIRTRGGEMLHEMERKGERQNRRLIGKESGSTTKTTAKTASTAKTRTTTPTSEPTIEKATAKATATSTSENRGVVASGLFDEDNSDTDSLDEYWDKALDFGSESGTGNSLQPDTKAPKNVIIIEDSEFEDDAWV